MRIKQTQVEALVVIALFHFNAKHSSQRRSAERGVLLESCSRMDARYLFLRRNLLLPRQKEI